MASNFLEEEELRGIRCFTKLPAVNSLCAVDHYMNWDNELHTGLNC